MRLRRLPRTCGIFMIALGASAWTPAGTQTITVDEGGFRLLVDGREVGRETFSIRQRGAGADVVLIAQGRVVIDTGQAGEELTTSLEVAGAGLRPVAYQIEVRGPEPQNIAGRMTGRRFSARIRSPAGERMREYLASDGAILADDGIAHHLYFVGRKAGTGDGSVPLIIPRQGRQITAAVSARGNEAIELAGERRSARRLLVDGADGHERHLWLDENGRVLRVEIPTRRYVAERLGR